MTDVTIYMHDIKTKKFYPVLYRDNGDGTFSPTSFSTSGAAQASALGTTTDAPASSTAAEDTTARSGVSLWKAIKNILALLNAKFVTGTIIGDVNVHGNCITKSVTFSRPAPTTQYTAKDCVNVDLAVSAATHATPIVVTTPVHGLADGDYVTITGCVGNTAANGSFYVKYVSTTQFSLYSDKALQNPVAGNGDWSSGGDVAQLFRLKGIFGKAGGDGYITRLRVGVNSATALLGDLFRIHFYCAPVTVQLDNLAYPLMFANFAKRCGYIDMPALTTEGSGSDMAYALASYGGLATNFPLYVQNSEAVPDTDLYFRVEELSAGTPAANQQITVEASISCN